MIMSGLYIHGNEQIQKQFKIIKMQQKESKTNKHFRVSMIKSGVRMIGCAALMFGNLMAAGSLLFIAECLGIMEEF